VELLHIGGSEMRANVLELGGGGSVSAIEEEGAW